MPTYVYECNKCGDELEVWQSFAEDPLKKHAGCGGKLTKVLQPVGIVLKGPGFYKTDSRNGAKKSSNGSESPSTPDAGAKSESAAATKTEPKKSGSEKRAPKPAATPT